MRPVFRVLFYFAVILLVAAVYLLVRGHAGVTGRNVLLAIPLGLLFAVLVWYRWDVIAPRMRAERQGRKLD